MKARTEVMVTGLDTGATIAVVAFLCILFLCAGLSFIHPLFWLIALLELFPIGYLVYVWVEENDITYVYDFGDFDEDKYRKKIIEFEGKYYRAYNFWGTYLRDSRGFDSVDELMDHYPSKEKRNNKCSIVGDL